MAIATLQQMTLAQPVHTITVCMHGEDTFSDGGQVGVVKPRTRTTRKATLPRNFHHQSIDYTFLFS